IAGVVALPVLGWPGLVFFVMGLALYAGLIATWPPSDLRLAAGDVWITMGALAISALAAASLGSAVPPPPPPPLPPPPPSPGPPATAWIPLLVFAELRWRRHTYEPRRWATVFPLGMYAAASHAVGRLTDTRALLVVAHPALWVAVVVWFLVSFGALRDRLS